MLHRALDDSYSAEVRRHITPLTMARTTANGCFRFAPPFLATISAAQGVTLDRMGVALAVSELTGLFSTVTGTFAERLHRRTAMWVGLAGVGVGALSAALSTHVVWFVASLVVLGQSKVLFDVGFGAWISDRVPFERRGRVIALGETSWAMGLLLGVTLMGLVAAVTSWRMGYVVGAVAVISFAVVVRGLLPDDAAHSDPDSRADAARGRPTRTGWLVVLVVFFLMAASQMIFVTFGSWLKDALGMGDSGVTAFVFLMGIGELGASTATARYADRWGKERATAIGAVVLAVGSLLVVTLTGHPAVAVPFLLLAVAGFEFAIVSSIPLSTQIIPGAPAKGISLTFTSGTFGRAAASIPATSLYVRHGIGWPAALAAVSALLAAATVMRHAARTRSAT